MGAIGEQPAKLTVSSNVVCTGKPYRPVVLTARDDHSVGERIGTAALSGMYADTALYVNAAAASAGVSINTLQIKHAITGITLAGRTDHVLSNVQIVNCNSGIKLTTDSAYKLRNALFDNVRTNVTGGSRTISRMEQVTSDSADYFNYSGTNFTIYLTNSVPRLDLGWSIC